MKSTICILLALVATQAVFVKKPSDPNALVFAEMEEVQNIYIPRLKNTNWEENYWTLLPYK